MRALYEALWGQEQDAGNFHKWFHGQRPDVCESASEESIAKDLEGIGYAMVSSSADAARPAVAGMSSAPA